MRLPDDAFTMIPSANSYAISKRKKFNQASDSIDISRLGLIISQ